MIPGGEFAFWELFAGTFDVFSKECVKANERGRGEKKLKLNKPVRPMAETLAEAKSKIW